MSRTRIFVFQLVVVFSLLYSLGAGLVYIQDVIGASSQANLDFVSDWESRMVDVKKKIPADIEQVGYISDLDRVGFNKDVYVEFALTQYALAPRLVKRGLDHEWIIVNSTAPDFLDWLTSQLPSQYTVEKFGSGIYLIHQGDS